MGLQGTVDHDQGLEPPLRNARAMVSICVPTYQGAAWIRETLAAALAQDYPNFEVVVSDDASTDGTAALAEALGDPRVRVVRSENRRGIAVNWNRSIKAAKGEYIKPLMQDDLLEPDCLTTMTDLLDRHPTAGFVFSPRKILLEDPTDAKARRWRDRWEILHDGLGHLEELNAGRRLYSVMRRGHFKMNCFGEPSAVMVRRASFEQVGLFAERMPQLLDEEMWLRLAFFADVGFVPRALVSIRVHGRSATTHNAREGIAWLDPLWLLEGLRQHPEMRRTIGLGTELRVLGGTMVSEAKRVRRMGPAGARIYARGIRDYIKFRSTRSKPALHATLGDPPA